MTISELERLAREATPGPWFIADDQLDWFEVARVGRHPSGLSVVTPNTPATSSIACDAAYIAAANPTAILALIERCRAMERVVEAARGIDARIGFSGGRAGVRFIEPAGIQRRELLDALLALDALGKEGA